ncbi:MAG: nitroreductase family protein [Pseudomonadota bacterium]|nr:nitroreductase family protein [Pseudomonadota bacterium]
MSVLTVPDAIEARRSVRKYTAAPVPDADLTRIITLAGRAPSAWNVQPWRFVAVRDPAVRAQLQQAAYGQPQVGAAPVVIVVYSDMLGAMEILPETTHPGMSEDSRAATVAQVRGIFGAQPDAAREGWGNAQSYLSVGFLLLAAQSLGYATSPMLGFDAAAVKTLLGIPAHATVPALVALGVAAEDGFPTHRLPVERTLRVV